MIENQNSAASVQPQRSYSLWSILTAVMFLFLPPLLLFGAAGTINWPMGWVYIALTLGGVILSRVLVTRIHPDCCPSEPPRETQPTSKPGTKK